MEEQFKIKDEGEYPLELIMCVYCGARLNRVSSLLPTSCTECNNDRFVPKVILVKEVIKIK